MKLFEYIGKGILSGYGIKVPQGKLAVTPSEAKAAAREINGPVVVKSQILSGKRGKGGGIMFASNPEQAYEAAEKMLGSNIVGLTVDSVLIEEKITIDDELYIAITVDSSVKMPVLIASTSGGMDIEEVSESKIVKHHIDILLGLQPYTTREISRRLGLSGTVAKEFNKLLISLYQLFRERDIELVEINPLVISGELLIACDAKIIIDEDALFRQNDLPYVEERNDLELRAHAIGLSYIQLDGDIAVMANGAGITMATLDTIIHYGGKPANFLDAGGGTGVEATAKALDLLLETNPKAILINIFGGITRCDDVANALARFKNERKINVPVIIRLVGTNEELGIKILKENGYDSYKMMHEAAAKAVDLARNS